MDNQNPSLAHEKILYRYSRALERGDFAAVAALLEQAEQDPALENLIVELNQAYQEDAERQEAQAAQHLTRLLGREAQRRQPVLDKLRHLFRWPWHFTPRQVWAGVAGLVVLALVVSLVEDRWGRVTPASQGTYLDALNMDENIPKPLVTVQRAPSGYIAPTGSERAFYSVLPLDAGVVADASKDTVSPEALSLDDRLLVRSASLDLVVADPQAALQAVQQFVASMAGEGAFVVTAKETLTDPSKPPTIHIAIRVPVARFDETMIQLSGLALKVARRTEDAQDVTEKYVDSQIRLQSMEKARDRLLEIMASAKDVKDLLMIEEQLSQRDAEIEALKGNLQYLEQTARLSSITVVLMPEMPPQPAAKSWQPADAARDAFNALTHGVQRLIDRVIYFAIATLPGLLVVGGLLLLVAMWLRRNLRRKLRPARPDGSANSPQ